MANWLLRIGLPGEARRRLSFAHEFAHFQTAPGALVYMIALFAVAHLRDRSGIVVILLVLASTQGFWEVLSEGLLVLEDPPGYRSLYGNISMFARTIFWMAGAALTVVGWVAVMKQLPF